MSDDPNQSTKVVVKGSALGDNASGLTCPTCDAAVDPRRTTQALSRDGRLMLFCTSGCLRTFLAAERAEKERAEKEPGI